jgi:DNA-binding transcriptional MerR regulator
MSVLDNWKIIMEPQWRLNELVQRSRRLLALLPGGEGGSRRVRWQPDARLVRYYTTLGLLDRPAELRGRTAYYRDRHLLQLLAIKNLQARGLSLQTVQIELAGMPDAGLARQIGLPSDWAERLAEEGAAAPDESRVAEPAPTLSNTARFWERDPASPTSFQEPVPALPMTELLAMTLAPGVQLLIDRRRYPQLDVNQLRDASRALCDGLRATARSEQENPDDDA